MLKLTVQDVERDRIETRYGSDRDLLAFLKQRFGRLLRNVEKLGDAVDVLNATDLYAVRTGQYETDPDRNLLSPDYRNPSPDDLKDPWPRAGDREE